MKLSRRQFNRGAAALSGAMTMPRLPLPSRSGSDDAYTALISELSRVEEAAHVSGTASASGGGAITATGRQLEAFIGHLDIQVSPFETAGQVYRELREFLKEQAKDIAREAEGAFERVTSDLTHRTGDAGVIQDARPEHEEVHHAESGVMEPDQS